MNKITIVIPNYNGIDYLENCLRSLYRQKNGTPPFEVLVVDNASGDGSIERARALYEKMQMSVPATRFLCLEENTGFCHAVNVGIRNSDTPYVILLNNDTKVKSGFVGHLYRAIKDCPEVFSVSARMLMWDRPELVDDAGDLYNVLGWASAIGKGKPATGYSKPRRIFAACGGAAIYSRRILDEIGLFDEQHFAYLEDIDIGYRALLYGYENRYEPRAQVLHYGSASTGSRYNPFKTRMAASNNIYMIYKNMPWPQILWNLPFLIPGFLIKWIFFCRKKMGRLYLQGIADGLIKCRTPEGRKRKIRLERKNVRRYLKVQWMLYVNTIYYIIRIF